MAASSLLAPTSVRDYFLEALESAFNRQSFKPHEATAAYLVDLLCGFASGHSEVLEQALALLLADSLHTLPDQSMRQLRLVGDQSLYVSGFFRDSLRRSQIDPRYYVVLGTTAYRRLSRVSGRLSRRPQLVIVYAELGREFTRFVEVLWAVREQSAGREPESDLADLYEEWRRSGSPLAARKLREAGVLLVRHPPGKQ